MDLLYKPWPWYVAGPVIGFTVPLLLWMGNKRLGISSTLRHICAACVPAKISLFNYDWKKEAWSLYFVFGLLIGGFIAGVVFTNPSPVEISSSTTGYLASFHIDNSKSELLPSTLFNWNILLSLKGFLV